MKNVLVLKCRKLIPLGYLLVQSLISLSTWTLIHNFYFHLSFLVIATAAYFTVSLKDPGYVRYQSQPRNESQLPKNCQVLLPQKLSSIIHSPQPTDQNKPEDKPQPGSNIIELGLQSKVKQTQTGFSAIEQLNNLQLKSQLKKYDKVHQKMDCIVQGQIGVSFTLEPSGFASIPSALRQIQRWCKQCKGYQQLRARHCIECGKCVFTFDHHCPWVNNCIGEKNRLILIIYLTTQLTQLVLLAIDLGVQLQEVVHSPTLLLFLAIVFLSVMILGVLGFQCLMICLNITTWEQLRWHRIQYLMIFSQKQLVSLFDRGFKENLKIFLKASCAAEGVKWQQHVNPNASSCLVASKSSTERRLSLSSD